jgi:hypothetical protein
MIALGAKTEQHAQLGCDQQNARWSVNENADDLVYRVNVRIGADSSRIYSAHSLEQSRRRNQAIG